MEHRHSGIATHTPASVHDGSWVAIEGPAVPSPWTPPTWTHPERFHRRPRPRQMPAQAWINQPPATDSDHIITDMRTQAA